MPAYELPPGFEIESTPAPSPAPQGGSSPPPVYELMQADLKAKWPNTIITSAKRTPEHNRKVGGAKNSYHLDGEALDIVNGPSEQEAYDYLRSQGWNLAEHIDEGDHVHLASDGYPGIPEGFEVESTPPSQAPHDPAKTHSVDPTWYTDQLQKMFDAGVSYEGLQDLAKGYGAPPIDEKRLRAAVAYRDRGGKGQKFELKPDGSNTVQGTPALNDTNALGATALAAADSMTVGVLPRIAAAGISLGAGADPNDPSLWNGYSLGEAYNENLKRSLAMVDKTAEEHPTATTVGTVAGAVAPIAPGLQVVKGSNLGLKSARLAKVAQASTKGAKVGAVYGAADAAGHNYSGDPVEIAGDAVEGGAKGAAIGGVLSPAAEGAIAVAPKVISKLSPTNRFVRRQSEKNPYAAYDAEIVEDLKTTADRATKVDPKGRSQVTAKEINALQRSYATGMKTKINALDIPQARKQELKDSLENWLTLTDDEVAALRTDGPGNAVADSITKQRRTYKLTPEVKPKGDKLGVAMDVGGALVGSSGGPLGAIGGAATSRILRKMLTRAGDAEAARVNSADKLIKRSKAYRKLQETVGPSGQRESQKALDDLYTSSVSKKEASKASIVAERAARAKEAKLNEADNRRTSIKNDQADIIPQGGFRGLLYENTGLTPKAQDAAALKLLKDGVITPRQFNLFLANPEGLMKGRGGLAIMDRLKDMADKGQVARDHKWQAPSKSPDLSDPNIRNPIAYAATAKGNQDRVTAALNKVQGSAWDPTVKKHLGDAISVLGRTSDKAEAEKVFKDTLAGLDDHLADEAKALLSPIVAAIKPRAASK